MGTDRKCELEAEVGRICIENGSNIVPGHQPKERIYSLSFTELALKAGTELSFGDAVEMLNRLLHREENKAIKGRTYQDFCQSSPNLCVKCIRQILETRKSALDWNGKWPRQGNCLQR